MQTEMQHQTIEHRYHETSYYEPDDRDEYLVGWLGFLVLGPALLLLGTALARAALARRREGRPVLRRAVLGSVALSTLATGAAYVVEAAKNYRMYQSLSDPRQ